MDDELRDALHKFIAGMAGEEKIEEIMKDEGTFVDVRNRANQLHAGEKTREKVLDFHLSLTRGGLEQAFKAYHAEHGYYPEPPDFSKLPCARLEDLGEKEKK